MRQFLEWNVHNSALFWLKQFIQVGQTIYTQYGLISNGPIYKQDLQDSGFFKQWLVKFSKLSNNLSFIVGIFFVEPFVYFRFVFYWTIVTRP